jgi:hypothetical protein
MKKIMIIPIIFLLGCAGVKIDKKLWLHQAMQKVPVKVKDIAKYFTNEDRVLVINSTEFKGNEIIVDDLSDPTKPKQVSLDKESLKIAEDGLISKLIECNIKVIEKIDLSWEKIENNVFYILPLSIEHISELNKKYGATKLITYRWIGYREASSNVVGTTSTLVRLHLRIIDTYTGCILFAGLIEEDYKEVKK